MEQRSRGRAFQERGGPWHRGLGWGDVGAGEEQRQPAGLDWSGDGPWEGVWSDHRRGRGVASRPRAVVNVGHVGLGHGRVI